MSLYRARQQQSAEPLLEEIRSQGDDAYAHEADLGDPANVGTLFQRCEPARGPLDVLVNNHMSMSAAHEAGSAARATTPPTA